MVECSLRYKNNAIILARGVLVAAFSLGCFIWNRVIVMRGCS